MKLPKSAYNWTSVIGGVIALASLFMLIFLSLILFYFDQGSSYLGLFIYIVIPGFLVIGLIIIPIGMMFKIRSDKKREQGHVIKAPHIDLNNARHRNAFVIFIISTTVFLFLTAIGSYEAFHYSESVEFCGTLCHSVMEPEYVAYQNSAHERVACVECHVGTGANWYVKSKLSGLYQVYSVAFKKYPTPIPTPLENLRPARETCEKCHWPEKFYAKQLRVEKYFLTDEYNTEWDIILEVKTSSTYSAHGIQEGIHWHINPDVKIDYIKNPDQNEIIPWVQYTNTKTNETIVYELEDEVLDSSQSARSHIRTMDCIDCHSRPSHKYKSPSNFIDLAFTAGRLPKDLPELKSIAMQVLHTTYPTKDTAMMLIANGISEFYESGYPDIFKEKQTVIEGVIETIQTEYNKYIFPEMKVTWRAYPDHSSHIESNGCFRCHDGLHTSKNGETISKDCNLCHNIIGQGTPDTLQRAMINDYLEFKHPVDIEEAWKEYSCTECHKELY